LLLALIYSGVTEPWLRTPIVVLWLNIVGWSSRLASIRSWSGLCGCSWCLATERGRSGNRFLTVASPGRFWKN